MKTSRENLHLYFLRHGKADWPEWDRPDDERPLTKKGKREMQEVARFLVRKKVQPEIILTSPLPRAAQTAQIAGERLHLEPRVEKLLEPGFGFAQLQRLLEKHAGKSLLLVGHEDDFSETIGALTGARCKLSKGGFAKVELTRDLRAARLIWLIAAKLALA